MRLLKDKLADFHPALYCYSVSTINEQFVLFWHFTYTQIFPLFVCKSIQRTFLTAPGLLLKLQIFFFLYADWPMDGRIDRPWLKAGPVHCGC